MLKANGVTQIAPTLALTYQSCIVTNGTLLGGGALRSLSFLFCFQPLRSLQQEIVPGHISGGDAGEDRQGLGVDSR